MDTAHHKARFTSHELVGDAHPTLLAAAALTVRTAGVMKSTWAKKPAIPSARPRAAKDRAAKDRAARPGRRPSALLDTRIIYCGDCLDRLAKLPDGCVDLIYIDPPFNSNRNYEVFWGESREKRAFEDRHASTQAYIDYMRPRCVELSRVLKKTGSFCYHCEWHASRQRHDSAFTRATRPILHRPCSWEVKHRDKDHQTT